MTNPVRKKRSLSQHQLNLTFMVAAVVFGYLTGKTWLLLLLVVVEIWYLAFTLSAGPMSGWFTKLLSMLPGPLRGLRWQPLLSWLLLMLSILFVVVPAAHVKFWDIHFDLPYERWEIAALTWNFIFSVICYVVTPRFRSQWCHQVYLTCMGVGVICTVFAIYSLAPQDETPPNYRHHLFWILSIAFSYVIADLLVCHDCPKEKTRFLKVLLYADLPTVFAMAFLLLFLLKAKHQDTMNAFLSGAIAFQFIANSFAFAFIEGGISEIFETSKVPFVPDQSDEGWDVVVAFKSQD
jgi:hypothetical protein